MRSRERRVKVKRGLFSYCGEEHLPRQNDPPNIKRADCTQAIVRTKFTEITKIRRSDQASTR